MILFLLIAFNATSQTDTTTIRLRPDITRLIIKDLIKGDGCSEQLQLTMEKLLKVETREIEKDKIVKLLESKDFNNQSIILLQSQQINTSSDLSKSLIKDTKKLKTKVVLWKTVSVGALIGGLFLAIQ